MTTITNLTSVDLGYSGYVSVEIDKEQGKRRYFDKFGNDLLYANLDNERDQWLLSVPKAVREDVEFAIAIDGVYVHGLRAAEKLALAIRNELDATGY